MRIASISLLLATLAVSARAGEPPKTTPGELQATVKFVTITGSGGWKLSAICAEPAGKPGKVKRPAVILTHMLGRKKEDWLSLVPRLAGAGFVVVACDMRGHGRSVGEDGKPKPWKKFLAADWAAAEKDLAAVHAWLLKEKKDVDEKRIALMGASIGANLSLRALQANPKLRGAVLLSAGLNYKGVKTEGPAAKLAKSQKLAIFATDGDSRGHCAMTAGKLSKAAGKDKVIIKKVYKGSAHGTRMFGKVKGAEAEIIKALQIITAPAKKDDIKSALDRIL